MPETFSNQYKKNLYRGVCGHWTVTIDRDPGVTPFMTCCPQCGETVQSAFYRIPHDLTATHEWYRPAREEYEGLSRGSKEHVLKGGLLLRPIAGMPTEQELRKQMEGGHPDRE